MNTINLIAYLAIVVLKVLPLLTLEHERSFLLRESSSPVMNVQFYKNSVLVTCNNGICQKDIETGAMERTFKAHTKSITTFLVTNDQRMITAGRDDMIVLWNLATGSLIKRIPLGSKDTAIARVEYQDDQLYTCGQDGITRNVDLKMHKVVKSIGELNIIVSTDHV